MATDQMLGNFVWHELMTSDTASAADFFSKVMGWNAVPGPVDPEYKMLMTGQSPVGGLMTIPDDAKAMGARPSWGVHISSPDVDATCRQAESLGARVLHQPMDIPSVGRFAVLMDPQGAAFSVFTPSMESMEGPMPVESTFVWHELLTSDIEAALRFYRALFGWEKTDAIEMPPIGTYQMYGHHGKTLGGIFKAQPDMPGGGKSYWLPYISVPDAKKTATATTAAGGKVCMPPMQVPDGGWIMQGMDLQGALFAVHSMDGAGAAKPATAVSTSAKPSSAEKPAKSSKPSKPSKPTKLPKPAAMPSKPAAKKSVKKAAKKVVKSVKNAAKKTAGKTRAVTSIVKKSLKKAAKKVIKKVARKRASAPARKSAKKKAAKKK